MIALTSRGKSMWTTLQKCLIAFTTSLTNLKPTAVGAATEVNTPSKICGDGTKRIFISGAKPHGEFDGSTADDFFREIVDALIARTIIFRWENTICYEICDADTQQLLTIATRQRSETGAAGQLANLICVGVATEKKMIQSIMSPKLVNAVLANQDLWRRLPRIRFYSRRPVFDDNFNLCGPGWHAEKGILVHGPEVTPSKVEICPDSSVPALDRLPPFLRGLLQEFCFQADADMVNTLAMLLTGVLINHFVDSPHPGFLIDGNQPGHGKTILVQAVGQILDGCEPPRIPLVQDDELEKKLCAQLRDGRSGVIFFDNARGHIESALLEANMLSPLLCFRILGRSDSISRPNTYLWIVTANLTSATTDYVRRNVPIRLYYDGDPKKRKFVGEPLEYAKTNRLNNRAQFSCTP